MLYNYINELDTVYPNAVDYSVKQKWLDTLEGQLKEQLADVLPEGTEIVGVAPYDGIYVAYLRLKCAERAGDINRYNNALTQFNTEREALFSYYIRNNKSTSKVGWKNVL